MIGSDIFHITTRNQSQNVKKLWFQEPESMLRRSGFAAVDITATHWQFGHWVSSSTTWSAVIFHSRKTNRSATQSLPSEDLSAQNAKIWSDHVWGSGRKTGSRWTQSCSIPGFWWTRQMKHILMGENQPYPQVFCYREALISHRHLRNLYNHQVFSMKLFHIQIKSFISFCRIWMQALPWYQLSYFCWHTLFARWKWK